LPVVGGAVVPPLQAMARASASMAGAKNALEHRERIGSSEGWEEGLPSPTRELGPDSLTEPRWSLWPGDSASIYFTPTGKEPEGFLVAYVGARTLTVRVKMNPGQQAESAQPYAVGLARIAAGRVR
jgi:hypothetical protein